MNVCGACGEDFGSVSAFDAHRVGTHAYDWAPARPDGRRCLSVEEIEAAGFTRNTRGRWSLSAFVDAPGSSTVAV